MSYNNRRRRSRRPNNQFGNANIRFNSKRNRRPIRRGPKKEDIHPSRFVKPAKLQAEEVYAAQNSFADFRVDDILHRNILSRGYDAPLPIQDQAIPIGLSGQDIIGIANTGTGKTVAFAIPVLNKLIGDRNSRALVVAPTRELAEQIIEEFKLLAQDTKVRWALLIGGSSMGRQFRDLGRFPSLVIGTPGRIKDHIERKSLDLSRYNTVVLDEVDRMLDMGFVKDMRTILNCLHQDRQSFFFSATIEPKVRRLIDEFASDPKSISVKTGDTTDTVEQDVVSYRDHEQKIEKLHDLLIDGKDNKVLIFDDTRRSVENLNKDLKRRGFSTDAIHGGKTQGQRRRALSKFKSNHTNVLVATDVAARGIDVADITHVINYSTPQSYDDYVHRIGRAGRAGRKGYSLTFLKS